MQCAKLAVPRGELAECLVNVRELIRVEPVMAGDEHSAAHDAISIRIAGRRFFSLDAGKTRLSQNIACEHCARLDVGLLEKGLHVATLEGRVVAHDKREGEPPCRAFRKLTRKNEPVLEAREEFTL